MRGDLESGHKSVGMAYDPTRKNHWARGYLSRSDRALGQSSIFKRKEYVPSQKASSIRANSAGKARLVRPGSGYRKMGRFARSSLYSSKEVSKAPCRRPKSVGPKQRRRSLPATSISQISRFSHTENGRRIPCSANVNYFGSLIKQTAQKADILSKRSKSSAASILVNQAFLDSCGKDDQKGHSAPFASTG